MTALPAATENRPADVIVGETIHVLARRAKVTQGRLARHLGITQPAISLKINGHRPWTLEELQRVATLLDCSVATLVELLPHLDSNQEPSD